VHAIMQKSIERKRYQEYVFEKKQQREAKKEEELYGKTEKFVTKAYKEKLLEMNQLEEEEKRRTKDEDVTRKKDMMDFYRNLLTKNVAYGASSDKVSNTKESKRSNRDRSRSRSPIKKKSDHDDHSKKWRNQTK
jgi:hypothetical protein